MAESNEIPEEKVLSADDPLDINELASLNEEISDDLIEQLQNKISASAQLKNDGDLFEEVSDSNQNQSDKVNNEIDDNFIKKYNAKNNGSLNVGEDISSSPGMNEQAAVTAAEPGPEKGDLAESEKNGIQMAEPSAETSLQTGADIQSQTPNVEIPQSQNNDNNNIEFVTGGNITERPLTADASSYNDSLDYLDGNVKYSKYVVYIDPENKDFIDSLTVKERKNLINRIIKEQDSISVTKRRFGKMQVIIMHIIVAILTVTIAIPCIYWTINASLEATINNYRASQSVFSQLYRQNGKIQTKNQR